MRIPGAFMQLRPTSIEEEYSTRSDIKESIVHVPILSFCTLTDEFIVTIVRNDCILHRKQLYSIN